MEVQILDKKNKKGFIALISITIIGVTGVLIAASILLTSTDSFLSVYSNTRALQARLLAETCVERGLDNLKTDYAGYNPVNESYTITGINGSCTIVSISGSGNNTRTMIVNGTSDSAVRKIQVDITTVNPDIVISSWQEIAD